MRHASTLGQVEEYRHIWPIRGSTTMRAINRLTHLLT